MPTTDLPEVLRGVAFKEGQSYIAVCLDHYLLVQVDTEDELPRGIREMIAGHILACRELGVKPFEDLPPAPQRFWRMYEEFESGPILRPELPPDVAPLHPLLEFRETYALAS